jgi:hypothetical protein
MQAKPIYALFLEGAKAAVLGSAESKRANP